MELVLHQMRNRWHPLELFHSTSYYLNSQYIREVGNGKYGFTPSQDPASE